MKPQNDKYGSGSYRDLDTLKCLLLGHRYVVHTTYKLKNNMGRALYGKLCERCGKFQPIEGAKQDYQETSSFQVRINEVKRV